MCNNLQQFLKLNFLRHPPFSITYVRYFCTGKILFNFEDFLKSIFERILKPDQQNLSQVKNLKEKEKRLDNIDCRVLDTSTIAA